MRLLILEIYKSMPKKLREDKDIDTLLQDVRIRKVKRKQESQTDIKDLK